MHQCAVGQRKSRKLRYEIFHQIDNQLCNGLIQATKIKNKSPNKYERRDKAQVTDVFPEKTRMLSQKKINEHVIV